MTIPHLKLFTDPNIFPKLDRSILTQFLERLQHCLPPQAAALLTAGLDYEQYCAAWPAQFSALDGFGQPLLQALFDTEALALPENQSLLDNALCHLPPGFDIKPYWHPLHQSLYLWLIAHGDYGFTFPIPSSPTLPAAPEPGVVGLAAPKSDVGGSPNSPQPSPSNPELVNPKSQIVNPPSPIQNQNSKIENPPNPGPPSSTPHSALRTPHSEAFARLAKLNPIEYELVRRSEAKRLHLRLAVLDDAVDQVRIVQDDAKANAVGLSQLVPWLEPIIDAPGLFDQAHGRSLLFLHLPLGAAVVLTLWAGHSHVTNAFTQTPRLNITSIEPGCGKSTLLSFLATLCPKVLRTDNLRTAVLFRIVERYFPTLLLDEVDSYLHLYPELRGLLNAGHDPSACVHRVENQNIRFFKSFTPTALAGLGHLSPTLRDRSIIIPLTKAPPGSLQLRFDRRKTETETIIGRKIARWAKDNFDAIAACDPPMPAYNRLADNWRPLFAVAQVIGGHWPQRILDAFNALTNSANPAVDATTIALLADIRLVFTQSGSSRLTSSQLVAALRALPGRPAYQPSTFDSRSLAAQLHPLDIRPRTIRVGTLRAKGYYLEQFAEVFSHLLNPDNLKS